MGLKTPKIQSDHKLSPHYFIIHAIGYLVYIALLAFWRGGYVMLAASFANLVMKIHANSKLCRAIKFTKLFSRA